MLNFLALTLKIEAERARLLRRNRWGSGSVGNLARRQRGLPWSWLLRNWLCHVFCDSRKEADAEHVDSFSVHFECCWQLTRSCLVLYADGTFGHDLRSSSVHQYGRRVHKQHRSGQASKGLRKPLSDGRT